MNLTPPSVMDKKYDSLQRRQTRLHEYGTLLVARSFQTGRLALYPAKDGLRNPELSKLDRDRLGNMAKAVTTLGIAYYFSGNEQYAKKSNRLSESMVPGRQNKNESEPELRSDHSRPQRWPGARNRYD